MNEDTELLALVEALEDKGMDRIAALALAREIAPDLGRLAYEWDYAAFVAGNQDAIDVTGS